MGQENDRAELMRRLEQVRRLMSEVDDKTSKDRMAKLTRDVEDQLKKSE